MYSVHTHYTHINCTVYWRVIDAARALSLALYVSTSAVAVSLADLSKYLNSPLERHYCAAAQSD